MTNQDNVVTPSAPLSVDVARLLIEREHGPILSCPALWRLLGYRSVDAFRKAVQRKTVPVETFTIPHRKGHFAKTADVVRWLDSLNHPTTEEQKEADPEP